MHVVTHLSEKYEALRTPENGWSIQEAGMAQLDDIVGAVMQKVKDLGVDGNTIVGFTTDNGTENFTWPDGGQTPFAGGKGTVMEGGFRAPMIVRWPGKVPAGKVENQIMSGLDWFPTLVAAAGNPNIADELKKGKQLGDRTYKVYLDGYNQMDLLTGTGKSKRNEIFYFAETTLGAVRIGDYKYRFIDQPGGWLGGTVKVDWPILVNLRLDPFERTGLAGSHGVLQLVRVRVLALRVRQAGGGEVRADLPGLPAHAKGRELQPGAAEGGAREEAGSPAWPLGNTEGGKAPLRISWRIASAKPAGERGTSGRRPRRFVPALHSLREPVMPRRPAIRESRRCRRIFTVSPHVFAVVIHRDGGASGWGRSNGGAGLPPAARRRAAGDPSRSCRAGRRGADSALTSDA